LNIQNINGQLCVVYSLSPAYTNYKMYVCSGYAQDTAWTCVSGIDCPLRLNTAGDVECMSQDGINCMWTAGNCAGTLASPPATINPLTCGTNHMNLYNSFGYEVSTHWCYRGWEYFKQWFCLPGFSSPMRMNPTGNPECLATNGVDCRWGTVSCSSIQFYDASSISPIAPLSCGNDHLAKYGSSGYDNTAHWCFNVLQQLKPTCVSGSQVFTCTGTGCTGSHPCPLACTNYQTITNNFLNGDYHNPLTDQSAAYGGWTDNCCTRIYLPTGVNPQVTCTNDAACQGYSLNVNGDWATLKTSRSVSPVTGPTAYVKTCTTV